MNATPRPLIAGNWKMHGTAAFAGELVRDLSGRMSEAGDAAFDMLVCPPAILLPSARVAVGSADIAIGGQDCHPEAEGAFTGEISASMLADAGCSFVIVGHSERRTLHGETDALVRSKAEAARKAGLVPVICIGETLAEREAGKAVAVVSEQLMASVPEGVSAETAVIAYEPVWAIGTGRTPTLDDIAEVHGAIRNVLADRVQNSAMVRILYGGSVKPENAKDILAVGNVNGALVGGASLKAADFWAIAEACA